MWAVGTAAYQTEGAFDKDGKGLSIWDTFTRGGNRIKMGDVGSDSYHNSQGDIRALHKLRVSHYRFSLSWPRIFPNGTRGSRNPAGVGYYRRLIARLKGIGVEPVVTLYHWDLPDTLQRAYQGWTHPLLVDIFKDYADFCFKEFGNDVKYWITIDNPFVVAWHGYGTGMVAPGIKGDPALPFRVGHNLLKAHAAVWHLYDERYRGTQGGKISMALGSHWINPKKNRRENLRACHDYPHCMKKNLSFKLPAFTDSEKATINGTADFFALSFGPVLSFHLINESLKFGQSEEFNMRKLLYWIKAEYDDPGVFIVENGWFVNSNTKTEDPKHMYYLKQLIMETLKSIKYDNVHIIGYTAWSLVDGFEWDREYGIRRGLFYVNFDSPDMKREPKTSALFYQRLIEKNGFPLLPENKPVSGVFPCNFSWGVAANSIQVEVTPSQFVDPSIYVWNISGNGDLKKLGESKVPPLRRTHCADYAAIRYQVSQVRRMHVSHFQFTLNWSSILPAGRVSEPNTTLLGYYKCFVSELLRANVTPVVALWHRTDKHSGLPASFDAKTGWQSMETVNAFADYARMCFRELGDHVKLWITLNEPNMGDVGYMVGHHLLKAHALAWRVYDREFRETQKGKVSLTLLMDWVDPAYSFSREDVEPSIRVLDFRIGWFAEPIFGDGNYPEGMRKWLQQRNTLDLFSYQLPMFTEEDKKLVRGTYDFFALSHYTTKLVFQVVEEKLQYDDNLQVHSIPDPTWMKSPGKVYVVPWGLRKALNWVNSKYKNVPIYIMANGVDEDQSRFQDNLRVYYIYNYINEALKAYTLDGVNLQGYFAYAFSDQTDPGFGLYGFVNDELIVKSSLMHYRNIIDHNGFPGPTALEQDCAQQPEPCLSCHFFAQRSVIAFLSFVAAAFLITAGLIIYYSRRCK
ncbi:KLOT protein, partial [Amia calva]|nr:KLOT protein [Amia calva]